MTIVPMKLFFNEKGIAKLSIGIGKGKNFMIKGKIRKEKTGISKNQDF